MTGSTSSFGLVESVLVSKVTSLVELSPINAHPTETFSEVPDREARISERRETRRRRRRRRRRRGRR